MTELLSISGSFALVWLLTWLVCGVLLCLFYPTIRRSLYRLHPADASSVLLLLLAFPVALSLFSTLLLFLPGLKSGLVSEHCHVNCQAHAPLIHSASVAGVGLFVLAALLMLLSFKLSLQLQIGRGLMQRLCKLASPGPDYWLLEDDNPLVFTVGWWSNQIFVTRGLLALCSAAELNIILAHEKEHVRRLDNVRLLLARLFVMILPSGLGRRLYTDLHVFTESACDLAAAEQYDRLDVASTLLKIQRLTPANFTYCDASITTSFTGAETEQRIRVLLTGVSATSGQFPAAGYCTLVLLFVSVLLVDPLHHGVELLLQLAGT